MELKNLYKNKIMILAFKEQFIEKINDGRKIHTIREDSKDRWHEGREIQMATGVRTKNYNQFNHGICWRVQEIRIAYPVINTEAFTIPLIFIDGKNLSREQMVQLAINDGFDSLEDFLGWFNEPFVGKIIHWTENFKY